MKVLLAADGSPFTKKAVGFLLANESLCGADAEIVVLNVQPPMPPRVTSMVGSRAVAQYHEDEANKVLRPIERILKRHGLAFSCKWVVGSPGKEILGVAQREKAQMIVMGTHGHGVLGRALMGSVAQNVVTGCKVPVLLVK